MRAFRGWAWHNWAALAAMAVSGWMAAHTLAGPVEGTAPAGPRIPRDTSRAHAPAAPLDVRAEAVALERLVLRAVDRDPFRADRQRGPGRYRTPAEEAAAAAAAALANQPPPPPAPPPAPEVPLVLRGIAADGAGRTLVAVEIGGAPRLMRVGEEFAGHRLLSAGSGQARFRGPTGVRVVRLGQ